MDSHPSARLHGNGISLMTPDPDWWRKRTGMCNDFHELFYVISGRLEMGFAHRRLRLDAMEWCLVPPRVERRTFATGKNDLAFFVVQWVAPVSPPEAFRRGGDPGGRLLTLLHWLLAEVSRTGPGADGTELANLLLPTIIAALEPASAEPDRGISRALTLMREQLDRRLRLAELAGYAGMSRETFLRHFKAQTGCTPNRFLTLMRIDRACALLRETTLPLDAVGQRCGWHDATRLCRVFAQHLHRKPGEIRRQAER